jgi:phosphoglycerate dehydrogenase-like enzyme
MLQNGKLTAAAIDVTDPEPLPEDSPLWKIPNLVI